MGDIIAKLFAPTPQAVVKKVLELGIQPTWPLKSAARICIDTGSIGEIGECSDDKLIYVIHGDVDLKIDKKTFEQHYHALPLPPRGLRYLTLMDACFHRDRVRQVYSFILGQFQEAIDLDLKAAGFTDKNYGSDWIALGGWQATK